MHGMRPFLFASALALLASSPALALTQAEIGVSALPQEAREVLALVKSGGPFVYERDGVVFGNREGNLPAKARGYYHEYTVPTPGAKNRGARRIVCGGPLRVPTVCYYSSDHYRTFARIRE